MRVLVDGAELDVVVEGNGERAIVLLAGFALSREIWEAQAETLAARYRVVRPDLRGMGASGVGPGPYLMETLAGDVAAVLDTLGIAHAAIVGHSLGGYVALAFARMYAERVERLGLVASRLGADSVDGAKERMRLADRTENDDSIEPVVASFLPRMLAPGADAHLLERVARIMRATDPHGAAAMLRGMALRDAAFDIAPDLTMPVVVVAGAHDVMISSAENEAAIAAFPRAELVTSTKSGHLPMLEEPAVVTSALDHLMTV